MVDTNLPLVRCDWAAPHAEHRHDVRGEYYWCPGEEEEMVDMTTTPEEAAKETIEDALPALSTEVITALHFILGSPAEIDIYAVLGEELERRRNAA